MYVCVYMYTYMCVYVYVYNRFPTALVCSMIVLFLALMCTPLRPTVKRIYEALNPFPDSEDVADEVQCSYTNAVEQRRYLCLSLSITSYIYIYIYIHTHTHIHIYIYISIYIHTIKCRYTNAVEQRRYTWRIYMYARKYVYMYVYVCR